MKNFYVLCKICVCFVCFLCLLTAAKAKITEEDIYTQPTPGGRYRVENFALSYCLKIAFSNGEISDEAAAAVGAYIELGSYPLECYEEVADLSKVFLEKNYISKHGAKLSVMKCIDLMQSKELQDIIKKYTSIAE